MSSVGNYVRHWDNEKESKLFNPETERLYQAAAYTRYSLGQVWNSNNDKKEAIPAKVQLEILAKRIKKIGRVADVKEFKSCKEYYGEEYWMFIAIKKDKVKELKEIAMDWKKDIRKNRVKKKNNIKLTVNSTMKEFKETIKKERLTLKEAQLIGILSYDELRKQKDKLHLLCKACFNKRKVHYTKSYEEYKKELEIHVEELQKLTKRFYPYIKYDW